MNCSAILVDLEDRTAPRKALPACESGEVQMVDAYPNIDASEIHVGHDVIIAPTAQIRAKSVRIGDNAFIGEGVVIDVGDFVMGDYSRIQAGTVCFGIEPLRIGRNCWIGGRCDIDAQGGLDIEDNVGIGSLSQVWTHIRHGDVTQGCRFDSRRKVVIGRDAWFVGSCLISPVFVGERSMALLGSVVTRDMVSGRTYAGVPARDITEKIGPQYEEIAAEEKARRLAERIKSFESRHPELSGTLKVELSAATIPSTNEITYFFVNERMYTKNRTRAETLFLSQERTVKFVPLGQPEPF